MKHTQTYFQAWNNSQKDYLKVQMKKAREQVYPKILW